MACQKIHTDSKEVKFEDTVASILEHAPNKLGGYRWKVLATVMSSNLSMIILLVTNITWFGRNM